MNPFAPEFPFRCFFIASARAYDLARLSALIVYSPRRCFITLLHLAAEWQVNKSSGYRERRSGNSGLKNSSNTRARARARVAKYR